MRKAFLRGVSTAAFIVGLSTTCGPVLAADISIVSDINATGGNAYTINPATNDVTLRVGDGVDLTKSGGVGTPALDRGTDPATNSGKAIVTFAGNSTVDGVVGNTYKVDVINVNGGTSKTVTFTENVAAGEVKIAGDGTVKLAKGLTGNITTADGQGAVVLSSSSTATIAGGVGTRNAALSLLWLDDSASAYSNTKTFTANSYVNKVKVDGANVLTFQGTLSGKETGGIPAGTDVEFTSALNDGTVSINGDATLGAITVNYTGRGRVEVSGSTNNVNSIGRSNKALGGLQVGYSGTTSAVQQDAYVQNLTMAGNGSVEFNGVLSSDVSSLQGTVISFFNSDGQLTVNGNANLGGVSTNINGNGNLVLRGAENRIMTVGDSTNRLKSLTLGGNGATRISGPVLVQSLIAEGDGQVTLILDKDGSTLGTVGALGKSLKSLVLNNEGTTSVTGEAHTLSTYLGAKAKLSTGIGQVNLGALTFGTEYDGTNWGFGVLDAQNAPVTLSSFNVDFGNTVSPNILGLWDNRGGSDNALLIGQDFMKFNGLTTDGVAVKFDGTLYKAAGVSFKEASNLPMTDNLALWKSMLAEYTISGAGTASLLMTLDTEGFLKEVASSGINMENFGGTALAFLSVIDDRSADPALRNFISGLTNDGAGIAVQQMADASVNNGIANGIAMVNTAAATAIATNVGGGAGIGLARAGGVSGINAGDVTQRNIAWVQALGSWNSQDRRDGVDGYNANTYGAALGADTLVWDSTRLGVALHYANTDVTGQGVYSNNKSKINTYGVSVYGKQALSDALFLDGRLGYAQSNVSSDRRVSGLGGKASGSYGVNQFDIAAKLGYDMWVMPNTLVTPHVSAAYTHLSEGGYTESGNAASLRVGGRESDALPIGVGVRGAMEFPATDTMKIVPEIRFGATYDVMASSIDTTAQFVGGGTSFITRNLKPDPLTFNFGAGVKVVSAGDFSVLANYDAALREGFMGHTASLRGKLQF